MQVREADTVARLNAVLDHARANVALYRARQTLQVSEINKLQY